MQPTPPLHIFVDALLPCLRTAHWPHDQSCHLLSDDLNTLKTFALALRLHPDWLQWSTNHTPHFDLTRGLRLKALLAGAQEISPAEAVQLSALWRSRALSALARIANAPEFKTTKLALHIKHLASR